jgi:glycosyltransferase involved in cell wall biosynthesis
LEKFTPQSKEFRGDIGILCHLTPRKRVYDLILTFYELTQKQSDLHLHIGGGADPAFEDYYQALHHLINELRLKDKVTFYGNVTEPWLWYPKIDIFVSNSYSEGLQVAPMEAMASGCYCLSHRWDGAEELLPEGNLFYTSAELQEKILHYCDSPAAEKNQQRAHMRAIACDKFDIRQTKAQIIQVIDEVAANLNAVKRR